MARAQDVYRLPPEPAGEHPIGVDAAGDVWQRGLDGLWYRALRDLGDEQGWTWFEIDVALGPMLVLGVAGRSGAPYTDELPTLPEIPAVGR